VGRFSDKSTLMRAIYGLLYKLPEKKIYGHYESFIKRSNRIESGWVRILTFPTPNKEYGYRREWYERSEKISFEGIKFDGIADYAAYLSFKFGKYMELPPEEMRKIHPVSEIKLV